MSILSHVSRVTLGMSQGAGFFVSKVGTLHKPSESNQAHGGSTREAFSLLSCPEYLEQCLAHSRGQWYYWKEWMLCYAVFNTNHVTSRTPLGIMTWFEQNSQYQLGLICLQVIKTQLQWFRQNRKTIGSRLHEAQVFGYDQIQGHKIVSFHFWLHFPLCWL